MADQVSDTEKLAQDILDAPMEEAGPEVGGYTPPAQAEKPPRSKRDILLASINKLKNGDDATKQEVNVNTAAAEAASVIGVPTEKQDVVTQAMTATGSPDSLRGKSGNS